MKLNNICGFISLLLIVFGLQSCIYKFNPGTTGGAQTLNIRTFQNHAAAGPPVMPQILTEKLKTYFQQNSNMALVNGTADWELAGAIISYIPMPVAAQQGAGEGVTRLTISVKATFINNLDPKKNYEQVFSFYDDFTQNESLSQVETGLINDIFDQIVFDIYTRTTSDW